MQQVTFMLLQEYVTEFHSISRKERGKSSYVSGGSDGVMLTAVQKGELQPSRPASVTVAPKQQHATRFYSFCA